MDTPDDLTMPVLLSAAFDSLVDAVQARLDGEGFPGIRATHGFAMQAIGEGCTGVELGQRLHVSKQAAAQTAKALETMGLVDRHGDALDRRARIIRPTARGREMLRRSASAFEDEVKRWRTIAGNDRVDVLLSTLDGITRSA